MMLARPSGIGATRASSGHVRHRSVAARWLCRSPLRLPRCRGPVGRAALASGAFRVFPNSDSTFRAVETVRVASLLDFASSSKRLAPDRSSEPLRSAGLFRANTASDRPASRGNCSLGCLASDNPRSRPLPEPTLPPAPSVAPCHGIDVFRSRGFSPPQRFTPRSRLGCIATRCRTRFVAFHGDRPPADLYLPKEVVGRAKVRGPLPATLFTPFEDTHADHRFAGLPAGADPRELRLSSVPRHRGRCRLAVFTTSGLYSDRGAGVARSPLPVA